MSKVVIIANQTTFVALEDDVDYIAVDGGSRYCLQHGIPLRYAIGDFDSISEEEKHLLQQQCECIVLPKEKDVVDTEYAIQFAHEKGYTSIDVYGVCGGRQDHFLTIFQMLKTKEISFVIKDEQNCIYRLEQGVHKIKKEMQYLSFFPSEPMHITITGVKYPLMDVLINESDTFLVSNEIIEEEATLTIDKRIIVVQSKS